VESSLDGVDFNMEFADQGTVPMANTCAGFGWEHEPFLDLGDDEEVSTVTAVEATGAQILDAYGARQRMPQQRDPICPMLVMTATPHGPRAGPSAGPSAKEGTAPSQITTTPAAPAQQPRTTEPDIGGVTDDAREILSITCAGRAANSPTMTGTFLMEWARMEKGIKHGSPSLSRNMASTMRKVRGTLCNRLAPWRLIHNRAVPKAHGDERVDERVASSWLDTTTCVRETGAAKVEDVFGGGTLVYAALVPREGEEERGFPRLRDPVIIPPKELERHDPELSDADKEGGEEEAREAAQGPVEDEGFSAEESMECSPEDNVKIAGASMEDLVLPAAEEGAGTSAVFDTERGPASLNPSADVATTERARRPCAAQSYKEVSAWAAQVPTLLPAGTEPFIGKKSYAQAIFGTRTCREFFCKGSGPSNDSPGGAFSDAALNNSLAQKAKDHSTMRGNTEPSKTSSTGSLGTQQNVRDARERAE
jgi:hypothetical protein